MTQLNVQVFADGADIEEMKAAYKNKQVDGFTTNPSLMAKAGVTDYKAFAEEAVKEIPDASIPFEIFSFCFHFLIKVSDNRCIAFSPFNICRILMFARVLRIPSHAVQCILIIM